MRCSSNLSRLDECLPTLAQHGVAFNRWRITIYNDCGELDYCEQAVSQEGQRWDFGSGDRTDPIALLSTWEHQNLERRLKAL
ncbi:DUF7693 family protein [Pseudomonas putida]|uniref:DUF7693 family protein n=1 Tax=Pseudomonas putida TaxID=303 RepID=UPI003B3A7569